LAGNSRAITRLHLVISISFPQPWRRFYGKAINGDRQRSLFSHCDAYWHRFRLAAKAAVSLNLMAFWIVTGCPAKIRRVENGAQDAREWVEQTVPRCWPEARLERLVALKGDASMRRFWRGFVGHPSNAAIPDTAIAVDLGPDDLPLYARVLNLVPEPLREPPFVSVHRLMERIGVAVPALYAVAPAERKMLVEDVGDRSLYEAVKADPDRTAELYRMAVDELLKIHLGGAMQADRKCLAYSIAYDRRLFRWEMEQFVEFGVPEIAPRAETSGLDAELDRLADSLGALPRVLSHRDYHFQNLFVDQHDGRTRIRVIDFQDALMAPAAQDLAVLLTTRDTGSFISPELEAELVGYYFDASAKGQADMIARAAFLQSYRWCVLQHALKVIGRFVFLERSGKAGYKAYLPATIGQARRMLKPNDEFPLLRNLLSEL
jgi:aminoglycoside/choline kinase family phosphotransferase